MISQTAILPKTASIKANMLFRALSPPPKTTSQPAFQAFLEVQTGPGNPHYLLRQSEHSRLAGQLAAALLPDTFGELPPEVIDAIAHHDYGWDPSDDRQLLTLATHPAQPFTCIDPSNTLPCWIGSIDHGHRLGPLAAALISRHCCLLGTGSPDHAAFIEQESSRRRALEDTLPYAPEQLDRWTAALGFCDLLSLYLCSGSRTPVEFPLAHPEQSGLHNHIRLDWTPQGPCFSRDLLVPGTSVRAQALAGHTASPHPLSWQFPPSETARQLKSGK